MKKLKLSKEWKFIFAMLATIFNVIFCYIVLDIFLCTLTLMYSMSRLVVTIIYAVDAVLGKDTWRLILESLYFKSDALYIRNLYHETNKLKKDFTEERIFPDTPYDKVIDKIGAISSVITNIFKNGSK